MYYLSKSVPITCESIHHQLLNNRRLHVPHLPVHVSLRKNDIIRSSWVRRFARTHKQRLLANLKIKKFNKEKFCVNTGVEVEATCQLIDGQNLPHIIDFQSDESTLQSVRGGHIRKPKHFDVCHGTFVTILTDTLSLQVSKQYS